MHELVNKADKALYKAKDSGKNQVCTADILDFESVTKETLVHANEKNSCSREIKGTDKT